MLRSGLMLIQLVGVLLSAYLVYVTFADQEQVERRVQAYAIEKVQNVTDTAWDKVTGVVKLGERAEKVGALARKLKMKTDELIAKRQVIVPALIRNSLKDKCPEGCGLAGWTGKISAAVLAKVSTLKVGDNRMKEFIVERYDRSIQELLSDLRRFGLVNLLALSLAMALVFFRGHLSWRFFTFSAAITAYFAWASYGYVYEQNWAFAFLFKDWSAPLYQTMMIIVSGILADWLFLKGRITEFVLDVISSATPS